MAYGREQEGDAMMKWFAVLGASLAMTMTASAIVHGIEEIPREINGRKLDVYWQEGNVSRGEAHDERNLILVEHPVPGTPERGCPLYVILHSAGHDAFSTLMCTRTVGNHDIYHPPADFYALYLDCRANSEKDWWWGAKSRKGFDEVACEKRVIDTVVWAISKYNINSNRVYLSGNSMGGSGTLGIGLRHGDIFAAIKANVPAIKWFNHPVQSLGLNLPVLPEGAKLPDPPVTVDYSAQNDDWSIGHEELIRGMRERKYQWMLFWGTYGHANNHAQIAKKNDIIHSFDWLSVRLDQPYPAFTDASTDDPSPWPDDRKNPKPGQINGFFRWDNALADEKGVSMRLRLATAAELKSQLFAVPIEATATVTVRRLGKFAVRPGDRIRWQFGKATGELTVAADGLVTVPKLTIVPEPIELKLSRPEIPNS